MADSTATANVMTTADGTPLKVSLERAMRRSRFRAFMLVAPLLAFITVAFVAPIIDMLFRSVENSVIEEVFPETTVALQSWDETSGELPSEEVYAAAVRDIKVAFEEKTLGRAARRLNYEKPGMSSMFRSSGRKTKRMEEPPQSMVPSL